MSVIIRLQNLPWSASAMDIRQFFKGLNIPPGGVHIIGGEKGDAFIAFVSDEDARKAMMMNNGYVDTNSVQLFLSSKSEMQNVIGEARNQSAPASIEQTTPPQTHQTPPQPYMASEYGKPADKQVYPPQDRQAPELDRGYDRPSQSYTHNVMPVGPQYDRPDQHQRHYDDQLGRYQDRTAAPQNVQEQLSYNRESQPTERYGQPLERRYPAGDTPKDSYSQPTPNGDYDRHSSHSQESVADVARYGQQPDRYVKDRFPDRYPPLSRDGYQERYPPASREGFPDRFQPRSDRGSSVESRSSYPPPIELDENSRSSSRGQDVISPRLQERKSDTEKVPLYPPYPQQQAWETLRQDPQSKPPLEPGPPAPGNLQNDPQRPWDPFQVPTSRQEGSSDVYPPDPNRFIPPNGHTQLPVSGLERDRSFDRKPGYEDIRETLPSYERNLQLSERTPPGFDRHHFNRDNDPQFGYRGDGSQRRYGLGPSSDWNQGIDHRSSTAQRPPSGLLETPDLNKKIPEMNQYEDSDSRMHIGKVEDKLDDKGNVDENEPPPFWNPEFDKKVKPDFNHPPPNFNIPPSIRNENRGPPYGAPRDGFRQPDKEVYGYPLGPPPADTNERPPAADAYERPPPRDANERLPPRDAYERLPPRDPYDAHERPPPRDLHERPPPRDLHERLPPRDPFERPPPRDPHELPPPRDAFERPPPRDQYERPPLRDQYERPPPRDQYERPPPSGKFDRPTPSGTFDRSVPSGQFDRPPLGFPDRPPYRERPPPLSDGPPHYDNKPPLIERQYDHPTYGVDGRPPSDDQFLRKGPFGYNDKIQPAFDQKTGRPSVQYDAKPAADTSGGSPMDIVDDQEENKSEDYPQPRGFQNPPLRAPFSNLQSFDPRFPNRPPPARLPDIRHPPPRLGVPGFSQPPFNRPLRINESIPVSANQPRPNTPFTSIGTPGNTVQPLIPGLVGVPDQRQNQPIQRPLIDDLRNKSDDLIDNRNRRPQDTDKRGEETKIPSRLNDRPSDVDSRNPRSTGREVKQDVDTRQRRDEDMKRDDERRDRDRERDPDRRRDIDRYSRDDRSRSEVDRRRSDYDRRDDRVRDRSRDYDKSRDYERSRDYNRSRTADRDRDRDSRYDGRYKDDRDSRKSPRDSRDKKVDEFGREKRFDDRDAKRENESRTTPSKTSQPPKSDISNAPKQTPVSQSSASKSSIPPTTVSLQYIPVPSKHPNTQSTSPSFKTSSFSNLPVSKDAVIDNRSVPNAPVSFSIAKTPASAASSTTLQNLPKNSASTVTAPKPLLNTSTPSPRSLMSTNINSVRQSRFDTSTQPGILGAAPPGVRPVRPTQKAPIMPRKAANDWEQRPKVPLLPDTSRPQSTGTQAITDAPKPSSKFTDSSRPPLSVPPLKSSPSAKIDAADPKGLKRQYRQTMPSLSIVVKNLPTNAGYRDVRKFFQGCEIPWDGLKMINDEEGKRIGVAYINFCSSQAYFEAIERNKKKLNDNVIEVKCCPQEEYDKQVDSFMPSKDNEAKKPKIVEPSKTSPAKTIPKENIVQVKGWATSVNKEELQKFFKDLKIAENGSAIYIEHDQQRRPTGMAMVKFDNESDFNKALSLDLKQLAGKTVHIKSVSQKDLDNLKEELKKTSTPLIPSATQLIPSGNKDVKAAGDAPKCDYTCVHLKGLPPYVALPDLQFSFFSGLEVGNRGIHLVLDSNGKSLGEAFAEFINESVCARALLKDNEVFMRKPVTVKPIQKSEMIDMLRMIKQPAGRANTGPQFGRRSTYYVKTENWPFTISIREVLNFFQGFNPIQETVRVQIGNDMQGSAAMVGFRSQEDAERAVNSLNKQYYRQRQIRMEPAHM